MMAGRSIFVTGGGSGIGRAVALRCAEKGAAVTVSDIADDDGNAVAAEIAAAGGTAQFVHVDVSDERQVSDGVDAAVERFGHLDGACNAAGMAFMGVPFDEVTAASWDRIHGVNLRGLFLSMKYQAKAMLAGHGGSIVNIASTAGVTGVPMAAEYCSSKAGVIGATRAAATDYAARGIRVNVVLPGPTQTKLLDHAFALVELLRETVPKAIPMGRLGEPDEIAFAVRWLLSGEASFVTGAVIPVDGGVTMV